MSGRVNLLMTLRRADVRFCNARHRIKKLAASRAARGAADAARG
jgi:hypothetical protein